MQPDDLLGLRLSEARVALRGEAIQVITSGVTQLTAESADQLRVARVKFREGLGWELLVVLPPVLEQNCQ